MVLFFCIAAPMKGVDALFVTAHLFFVVGRSHKGVRIPTSVEQVLLGKQHYYFTVCCERGKRTEW